MWGARAFYFILYFFFYLSAYLYPNTLRDYLDSGRYLRFGLYFALHSIAIFFFLTSGSGPGWVTPDEALNDEEETSALHTGETIEERRDIELGRLVADENSEEAIEPKTDIAKNEGNCVATQPSFGYIKELDLPPNRGCDICGIHRLPFRAKHCRDCQRCVRKYDHHCFWVGGCVGELNHRKFYGFISIQTIVFLWNIKSAIRAYTGRFSDFPGDEKMQGHVSSVWMLFIIFALLFLLLTGGLTVYHSFLIATAQSSWEHTRRDNITYLKVYPRSILPFYVSVRENVKSVFCHGGKYQNWKLRQPHELKEL